MSQLLDTSNELQVFRYQNGIKLIRSEEASIASTLAHHLDTQQTVQSLLSNPFGVYFYNLQNEFQNINEYHAKSCGFISVKNSLGKTLRETAFVQYANKLMSNNKTIITTEESKVFDEELFHLDGNHSRGISIKLPWYNNSGKVIGVLGCTALIDAGESLAEPLNKLIYCGLFSSATQSQVNNYSSKNSDKKLSPREIEISYQLIRGRTAKLIAAHLTISHRTVEQHIVNIKRKLSVYTKTQLIECLIDYLSDN